MALSNKQKRFIIEYPIDSNGTQAAIRAGYSPDSAGDSACDLLRNQEVWEAICERFAELARVAAITPEFILTQWRDIAIADPNDLIYLEVECCRHCWGINHEFQWTEFGYRDVCRRCFDHVCKSSCEQPCAQKIPPLAVGGFGFDPHRDPNPDCPSCHGNGYEAVRLCDTRRVKGPARKLYAGIKKTKDGIQVLMHDQDAARINLAKYMGMLVEKKEIAGPGGSPIGLANFTAKDLTDDQIAAMLLSENSKA